MVTLLAKKFPNPSNVLIGAAFLIELMSAMGGKPTLA